MTDDFIDTTDSHALEPGETADTAADQSDPAVRVVVALANELQKAYAEKPQQLAVAQRSLRIAHRRLK